MMMPSCVLSIKAFALLIMEAFYLLFIMEASSRYLWGLWFFYDVQWKRKGTITNNGQPVKCSSHDPDRNDPKTM